MLDQKGILYQLKIAVNVEEALHFLENENHIEFGGDPDIILLDIDLPRINGLEFLAELRRKRSGTQSKFLFCSNSEREKENMTEVGVSGILLNH